MPYVPRRAATREQHVVRGLAHRITRWGPPHDSPIVLLHGFMDASETFQFLVDELPDNWSFAATDWRGFGGSAWQGDGYWFPDYLADLEAILTLLAPRGPARVIGHSLGANVASLYAGVRPARLAWLVNLEGFGLPRSSSAQAPDRFARWLDELAVTPRQPRYASPEQLAQKLRARNPRLAADRADFLAATWLRSTGGEYRELVHDPRHRLVNPILYRREEAEACWRRCGIPMLLLLGEHSEYRSTLGADGSDEYFRDIFPAVEIATLAGVGHMMHHEDPRAVARRIESFVQRMDARAE